MSRNTVTTLVVVALGVVGFATYQSFRYDREYAEWNDRVESVLEQSRADSARAVAAVLQADSAERVATAAEARANELAERTRERVVEVREVEVPAEAEPFVAPRDSIIDELLVENDNLRTANAHLRVAVDTLRAALFRTQGTVRDLQVVLEERPGPRPVWQPEVGLGVFAGACTDGPCAGVGLTATWRVPLGW